MPRTRIKEKKSTGSNGDKKYANIKAFHLLKSYLVVEKAMG